MRFIYSNGLNEFVVNEINQKTDLLEKSLKKILLKNSILPTLISLSPIFFISFNIAIFYSFFQIKII